MAYNVPWNPRDISENSLTLSFRTLLLPCSLQRRELGVAPGNQCTQALSQVGNVQVQDEVW